MDIRGDYRKAKAGGSEPLMIKYSLDGIFYKSYISRMKWDVEYTDEFGEWWASLSEGEQESLVASVNGQLK